MYGVVSAALPFQFYGENIVVVGAREAEFVVVGAREAA